MTEQERDDLLSEIESMFLKRKVNCKTEKKRRMYGISANLIHRERSYKVTPVDANLGFGRCICGEIVKLDTEPFYCSKCGQRLSMTEGFTADNYYNEKNMAE